MLEVPLRARSLVVGVVARVGLLWAVPFLAVATSPWLGWPGVRVPALGVVAVAVPPVVVVVACLFFPHGRFGDWAAAKVVRSGAAPSSRMVNLTEELSLATGSWSRHRVVVVDSPVPNAAALPGGEETTVVVTTGAEVLLSRDQLEALLATQVVVASDPWVRLSTAAQFFDAPRFAVLFSAGFANPVLLPLAFLAFLGHRRGDAVRDMVADFAALRATRHPEALGRALFGLRPAAPHAASLRVGLPGFLVDQYWVLSTRSQSTTTISSTAGGSRQWTTADEIAAEMAARADRLHRGAQGEVGALFDMRAWKQATRRLGTWASTPAGFPLRLTAEEVALAERIGDRVRSAR